jgi:phospholipase C
MDMGLENIQHIVVVMFENRSFDNLLGYLYGPNDLPAYNLPPQSPTTFNGLSFGGPYSNTDGGNTQTAANPTSSWPPEDNPMLVPTPDPGEGFDDMTQQIFGTGSAADMSGFLTNYTPLAQADGASGNQIMQSFSPAQTNVLNTLAKSFAVSDAWYASAPCQTWPNRGFAHTGSADGYVDNDTYLPYDIDTIFNVLTANNKTWGVYANTTYIPSLTHLQFVKLWTDPSQFYSFSTFQTLCAAAASAPAEQKLPSYSFVEPRFTAELTWSGWQYPQDYHPPNNVCLSEQFLASVYSAVANSPYRDNILLVVLFDEHGGCYDHQAPPSGATAPEPYPVSRDGSFNYDRFGVRVPAIVISSYVQPGTVFRASGSTPYDHTSILNTLNGWLSLTDTLPSPRIAAAPTLDAILTESTVTATWPSISSQCTVGSMSDAQALDRPVTDLEISIVGAAARLQAYRAANNSAAAAQNLDPTAITATIKTSRDAALYLQGLKW